MYGSCHSSLRINKKIRLNHFFCKHEYVILALKFEIDLNSEF
jgi:hypothetical protein